MDVQQRTIASRYELQTLIATGGMGQVWRGRDALLERPVAVKVLRSEFTGDRTFLARFRGEAHHAARLAHRNIAAVYDYGEVVDESGEHLAYLVMELVDGEPLSTVLAREGRLDADRTLDLVHQTAAALASAHAAGVVHRDVKPGNLLLGRDGVVKITDFGIAWSASDVPLTRTGEVVGTAHYLSPEQATGSKAGPASDVYALGMIGYECLAGRRAFDGDNAVQIALRQVAEQPDPLPPDVPDGLRALVGRALAKDPALRFPDGAALTAAAVDVRAGRPLPAPPPDIGTAPLWLLAGLPAVPAGRGRGGPVRAGHLAGLVRASGRRSRVLTPLLALAAGAAIGIGGLHLLSGTGTTAVVAGAGRPAPGAPASRSAPSASAALPAPTAGRAATTPAATTPDGIELAAADYVGRPVDQVRAELTGLGLVVQLVPRPAAGVLAGQVSAISPVGTVHRGDVVTVVFATPAAAPATGAPATGSVPIEVAQPADPGPAGAADRAVHGAARGPAHANQGHGEAHEDRGHFGRGKG